MEERVQKILARFSYGSRRDCEKLITAGRVIVNGKLAELGMKAEIGVDSISVDGKTLKSNQVQMIYVALNKPTGVLSDADPESDRKTVLDLVPVKTHLFTVGRLDYNSEGLILLTNDGDLANKLTHPRYGHEKEYDVLVIGKPDEDQIGAWRRGIVLPDGTHTRPARVDIDHTTSHETWLKVILKEGKKRQIREMGSCTGLPVRRIIRIRISTLKLGDLKPSEFRYLKPEEVEALKRSVSVNKPSIPSPRKPMNQRPPRRRGLDPVQKEQKIRKTGRFSG